MAEGKKLAIHKNGLEVELQNCRETRGVLPMMAYKERSHTPSLQASSPIWASERRSREGPTTTFDDIPQL